MKSTLWITCKDEWKQTVQFADQNIGRFDWERHVIYETLQLLKTRILGGLFSNVIITDDGSTDDTLDGIEQFKKENDLRESVFSIIRWTTNVGKMGRFEEAFIRSRASDIFVMTDGDMVSPSRHTFEKLVMSWPGTQMYEDKTMLVSILGEFNPPSGHYEMSNKRTSWTRSLIVSRVQKELTRLGITDISSLGEWYGLEVFLNWLFWNEEIGQMSYVNKPNLDVIPLFLRAFRKWRNVQSCNISNTVYALDKFLPRAEESAA